MIVRAILLVTLVAVAKAGVNWKASDAYYCGNNLSCNGTPNAMCRRRLVFGPECRNPAHVRIDERIKQIFLDIHNELRNHQALGKNENFLLKPHVADMSTMQWDDELELMSLANVMQCKLAKDDCRRTANYKHVGQNLYELCSSSKYPPIGKVADLAVKSWFYEGHEISNLAEQHFVDDSTLAKSGQFLQLVKSNADRIGCSAIEYRDVRNHSCTIVGCLYNAGSIVDVPTYELGPTASSCKTGRNRKFEGLCSENEDYTKHEYADIFFTNNSPVVDSWLKNRKRIDTGGEIVRYRKRKE